MSPNIIIISYVAIIVILSMSFVVVWRHDYTKQELLDFLFLFYCVIFIRVLLLLDCSSNLLLLSFSAAFFLKGLPSFHYLGKVKPINSTPGSGHRWLPGWKFPTPALTPPQWPVAHC